MARVAEHEDPVSSSKFRHLINISLFPCPTPRATKKVSPERVARWGVGWIHFLALP